jgi:hypothetical protein
MFRNLGTLTVVVMLSFLVGLGLSRGILAAVLKAMSCRSFRFTGSKARLVSWSRAKTQWNSGHSITRAGLRSVRSRMERAHGRKH